MKINNYRFKLKKEHLLIFLLVLPQLKPESLDYISPIFDMAFNIGKIVSFIVIMLLYLSRRRKPSKIVWMILALQGWIVITTYLNKGNIRRAFFSMLFTTAILMVIDFFPIKSVIAAMMVNFEWLIYVNLLTLIIFPQGLYRQGVHGEFVDYFLGFKNSFFSYCVIAILLAELNFIILGKKIRSIFLMAASFLNVYIGWSASSVVSITIVLLMFLMLIVVKRPKCLTKIKFQQIFVIALTINILISIFNIAERSKLISNFIVNVLHKQTTLSGRTIIWGFAAQMIVRKLIIGYGIGEHITWAGYNWYGHNQYFEMLLEGGIPCLLLFFLIIFTVNKCMKQCKNRLIYDAFIIVFTGIFIFYLVEAGTGTVFYIMYVLAFHIKDLSILMDQDPVCLNYR